MVHQPSLIVAGALELTAGKLAYGKTLHASSDFFDPPGPSFRYSCVHGYTQLYSTINSTAVPKVPVTLNPSVVAHMGGA